MGKLVGRICVLLFGAQLIGGVEAIAQEIPTDESGFTAFVAERVRQEVAGAPVGIKGPLTLSVGSLQANLDRIYAFCRKAPTGCAREIDTYAKGVAQTVRDQGTTPTKDALRLVVRPAVYARQAGVSILEPRPFAGGLVVLPAFDLPRTIKMMTDADGAKLGLTGKQAHDLGTANLRRTLKPLGDVAKPVGHGQIGHLSGDFFHPSRLVLLDSWAPLAKAQGGVLIVAAPTTNAVFYIGEDSDVAIGALRALVRNIISRAPNQLSDVLLRWSPKGWTVVP